MDDPIIAKPEEIVALLVKTIGDKTPAREVEFGYDEDNPLKWWAKARMRSGRVRSAEVIVTELEMGPVEALAELGRELGLSIRVRDPIHLGPGEEPG